MIVSWPFEVQSLFWDTFKCTFVYIWLYPCEEDGLCISWNSFDLKCESVTYHDLYSYEVDTYIMTCKMYNNCCMLLLQYQQNIS